MRRLAALLLVAAALPAGAVPSTFAPVVGGALLCHDDIDHAWFHAYLSNTFGPSYKHEGGAYWFRADATLWGTPVREVLIGDGSGGLKFIAAVADATPDELTASIRQRAGIRYRKMGASRHAMLESGPGSRIAWFRNKSKIYCAKAAQQTQVH